MTSPHTDALTIKECTTAILALLLLCVTPHCVAAQHRVAKLSTPDDLKAEFASVPCDNEDRVHYLSHGETYTF